MRAQRKGGALAAVLAAVGGLGLAGCGEPTAQVVTAEDSPVSFEVPIEYADLSDELPEGSGTALIFGRPDEVLGTDPVFSVVTFPDGSLASFQSLRMAVTGGFYDPLDPEFAELAGDTEVLAYTEITDSEVWGIRIWLEDSTSIYDFQALVDRESDQVTLSRLACTQACFQEQIDLIDQIQSSWTLGAT